MKPKAIRKGPPMKADWPAVDWSKTNKELVKILGVAKTTIDRNRKLFGRPRIDWTAVDWSQTNKAIRRATGSAGQTIRQKRLIHAPDTMPERPHAERMATIDWHTVDWSIQTGKLARQLGVPRSYVYEMRCQYAPETISRRRKISNDTQLDWSKSDVRLASDHNLGYETVRRLRRIHAPETVPSNRDWKSVDWSLNAREIARLMRCSTATVCNKRKKFARDTTQPAAKAGWSALDWSLSNYKLAKATGAAWDTVQKHREKHAPETVKTQP